MEPMMRRIYGEDLTGKVCDACCQPASQSRSGLMEVPEGEQYDRSHRTSSGKLRNFRFTERIFYGCEDHPPITACYNLEGTIAPNFPDGYEPIAHAGGVLLLDPNPDVALTNGWTRVRAA